MPWPRFLFWNALGGISWACTVGLLIYFVGHAAKQAIATAGFVGLGLFVVAAVAGYLFFRRRHRGADSKAPAPRSSEPPGPGAPSA